MSTRTPLTRRVIAALLMVMLTACQSWRPATFSPRQLLPEDQPSSLRVTLMNGETVTVRDPIMRNDSIVGATDDADVAAVASQDVRLLEVQRLEVGRTIVSGLLLGVVTALAVAMDEMSGFGSGGW